MVRSVPLCCTYAVKQFIRTMVPHHFNIYQNQPSAIASKSLVKKGEKTYPKTNRNKFCEPKTVVRRIIVFKGKWTLLTIYEWLVKVFFFCLSTSTSKTLCFEFACILTAYQLHKSNVEQYFYSTTCTLKENSSPTGLSNLLYFLCCPEIKISLTRPHKCDFFCRFMWKITFTKTTQHKRLNLWKNIFDRTLFKSIGNAMKRNE